MDEKKCNIKGLGCIFGTESVGNIIKMYYEGTLDDPHNQLYNVHELNPDDSKKSDELCEEVKKLLDKDGKELFDDFLSSENLMQGHQETERFVKGFQCGAKFAIDVFKSNSIT